MSNHSAGEDGSGKAEPLAEAGAPPAGELRLDRAHRGQVEFRTGCLEDLLPDDHRARKIWAALERLDLSDFYAVVVSRAGMKGRRRTDPKVLLCLWLFATSENVGSARRLARLCERDAAYQWILGGITTNH